MLKKEMKESFTTAQSAQRISEEDNRTMIDWMTRLKDHCAQREALEALCTRTRSTTSAFCPAKLDDLMTALTDTSNLHTHRRKTHRMSLIRQQCGTPNIKMRNSRILNSNQLLEEWIVNRGCSIQKKVACKRGEILKRERTLNKEGSLQGQIRPSFSHVAGQTSPK